MRRVLIALFIITGFALSAAPAVADEGTDGSTTSTSSDTTEPKAEDSPPPPAETTPPPETPPAGTETPGTETPGTETPGTETPGTETPGTETPGTETPGTGTPGTETPGTGTPGTGTPGTETPGSGTDPTCQSTGDPNAAVAGNPTVVGADTVGDEVIPQLDCILGDALAIVIAAAQPKVDICHARSAVTNPYGPQRINVSVQSILNPNGHATHTGPVFPAAGWGDIIPPFDFGPDAQFGGLNWDGDGQAIFFNNCQVPGDEEPPPPGENKVPICHARDFGSQGDPYNTPNPSVEGILNGHAGHTGPVFFPGIQEQWGDIIPPFDFGPGAQFDGLNWDADGQAIYFNGCVVPEDNPQCEDDPEADCDGDDDECEEDCDDDDDHKAAALPDTGGPSLWILLMGGLFTALGMTVLTNRESMSRTGLFGPVALAAPSVPWSYRFADVPDTAKTSHRTGWTALGAALVAAAVLGGRHRK